MENDLKKIARESETELDFIKIFQILWKNKIHIVLFTFCFGIFSIFYALSLKNIYQSEAVLSLSSSSGSSLSRLAQNYSGLANLAGINLPDIGGDGDGMNEGIETIKSLNFLKSSLTKMIFM